MKSLQDFLRNFFQNKGQHVFLSLLVAKICAFAGSLCIIRILPENEFGTVSIVASVFALFATFSGFGNHQSLLRFGSITDDISEKKALSKYLMLKGFGYQLLLSLIFLLIALFYIRKYGDIFYIFVFFAVRLIGIYFFSYIQSELRIFGNNREFARINNVVNISGVVVLLLFCWLFGISGYLIATALTPFIALFWFKKENFKTASQTFSFNRKEIWDYGLHASGTAFLSDALFSSDVLILSFLMNENAVANYKVAILIPANITFLALTFMQSDFPELAKNYQNRDFLTNYIRNYYKIFIPVSVIIFLIGFIFKTKILRLFFSAKYADNSMVFAVLLGGFCLNMLFRNLYGNLLSAVGKMKINTVVSTITLAVLIAFSFILVPKFGVNGMATGLAITLFLNGLLLMFSLWNYLRNLK